MNQNSFFKSARLVPIILIVVLYLLPNAWASRQYKTMYKFSGGNDGSLPYAALILDGTGNLYGTTSFGGAFGQGTIFELSSKPNGGWKETVLHNFTGGRDGGYPYAGLIFDPSGNLYGTASSGGDLCLGDLTCGVVFKLAPNPDGTWTESTLYAFQGGNDGWEPLASVVFDAAGNLYGTAVNGGTYGTGVIFKLSPNPDGTWTQHVLHAFGEPNDGANPTAGLVLDLAGNLYGTTATGGAYQHGVAFRLTPRANGTWKEKILHHFTGGSDGGNPLASLIFDWAGNLYGTASQGGDQASGVIFQLHRNEKGGWKERVLYQSAGGMDGTFFRASLIFDGRGHLYGMAPSGGSTGFGVVFELTPRPDGSWRRQIIHNFKGAPGAHPYAGLILDARGILYGTTAGDPGTSLFGSVFEITP